MLPKKPLARYVCRVAYDGSKFGGWAVQPGRVTVQGELQAHLSELYGRRVAVCGSGRTDAKVHALAQTFHFDAPPVAPEANVAKHLNRRGGGRWRVFGVRRIARPFHARFSAKSKTYLYKIATVRCADPLTYDYCWQIDFAPNLRALRAAAALFLGEHDFLSFSTADANSGVRTINSIKISKAKNVCCIRINGNGFLRNMVRMIVGSLVWCARGKITPEDIQAWLDNPKKGQAAFKAPGAGLYLQKVSYGHQED